MCLIKWYLRSVSDGSKGLTFDFFIPLCRIHQNKFILRAVIPEWLLKMCFIFLSCSKERTCHLWYWISLQLQQAIPLTKSVRQTIVMAMGLMGLSDMMYMTSETISYVTSQIHHSFSLQDLSNWWVWEWEYQLNLWREHVLICESNGFSQYYIVNNNFI